MNRAVLTSLNDVIVAPWWVIRWLTSCVQKVLKSSRNAPERRSATFLNARTPFRTYCWYSCFRAAFVEKNVVVRCDFRAQITPKCISGRSFAPGPHSGSSQRSPRRPASWFSRGRFAAGEGKRGQGVKEGKGRGERGGERPHFFFYNLTTAYKHWQRTHDDIKQWRFYRREEEGMLPEFYALCWPSLAKLQRHIWCIIYLQIQIQIRTCTARLRNCPGALTKCQKTIWNRWDLRSCLNLLVSLMSLMLWGSDRVPGSRTSVTEAAFTELRLKFGEFNSFRKCFRRDVLQPRNCAIIGQREAEATCHPV